MGLKVQGGQLDVRVRGTCKFIIRKRHDVHITFCLNQEIKSGLPFPAPCLRRVSASWRVGVLVRCQNCLLNSLFERETNRLNAVNKESTRELDDCRKGSTRELDEQRTYFMYGSTSDRFVNTYSMILRHSSKLKVLIFATLALPSCPLKRLRFESASPAL